MPTNVEPLHEIADDLFKKFALFPTEQRNAYIMGFIDGVLYESEKKQHVEIVVTTGLKKEKSAN